MTGQSPALYEPPNHHTGKGPTNLAHLAQLPDEMPSHIVGYSRGGPETL
jgi:hypothetical protein